MKERVGIENEVNGGIVKEIGRNVEKERRITEERGGEKIMSEDQFGEESA